MERYLSPRYSHVTLVSRYPVLTAVNCSQHGCAISGCTWAPKLDRKCEIKDYNGGQKCWDLSSDITKTSDPSPPTPNKVEFGAKWVRMSAFLATTLLGGVGERRDEPKAEQKIVLRSRVLRNNCLEGLFHTVPSSFVLHCLKLIYSDKMNFSSSFTTKI